ncbi:MULTISPECIES: hypothetical protein [Enterobacteriaceae]|uniref:hypothetical protein n=1 Tax=Enterobacteriaceae TaxID=543 RepID=UPI003F493FBE
MLNRLLPLLELLRPLLDVAGVGYFIKNGNTGLSRDVKETQGDGQRRQGGFQFHGVILL